MPALEVTRPSTNSFSSTQAVPTAGMVPLPNAGDALRVPTAGMFPTNAEPQSPPLEVEQLRRWRLRHYSSPTLTSTEVGPHNLGLIEDAKALLHPSELRRDGAAAVEAQGPWTRRTRWLGQLGVAGAMGVAATGLVLAGAASMDSDHATPKEYVASTWEAPEAKNDLGAPADTTITVEAPGPDQGSSEEVELRDESGEEDVALPPVAEEEPATTLQQPIELTETDRADGSSGSTTTPKVEDPGSESVAMEPEIESVETEEPDISKELQAEASQEPPSSPETTLPDIDSVPETPKPDESAQTPTTSISAEAPEATNEDPAGVSENTSGQSTTEPEEISEGQELSVPVSEGIASEQAAPTSVEAIATQQPDALKDDEAEDDES